MVCNVTPRFRSILKMTILTLQLTISPSCFTDPALKNYQILEKYLFSDAEAENGFTFRINISKYFSVNTSI